MHRTACPAAPPVLLLLLAVVVLTAAPASGQVCRVSYDRLDSTAVDTAVAWAGATVAAAARVDLCEDDDRPLDRRLTIASRGPGAPPPPPGWWHRLEQHGERLILHTGIRATDGIGAQLCAGVHVGNLRSCEPDSMTPRLIAVFVGLPAFFATAVLVLAAYSREAYRRESAVRRVPGSRAAEYASAPGVALRRVEPADVIARAEALAVDDDDPDGGVAAAPVHGVAVDARSGLGAVADVHDDPDGAPYCTLLALGSVLNRTSQLCVAQLLRLRRSPRHFYFWCRVGRLGTDGHALLVECADEASALYEFFSLVKARSAEGWVVVRGPADPPAAAIAVAATPAPERHEGATADFSIPEALQRAPTHAVAGASTGSGGPSPGGLLLPPLGSGTGLGSAPPTPMRSPSQMPKRVGSLTLYAREIRAGPSLHDDDAPEGVSVVSMSDVLSTSARRRSGMRGLSRSASRQQQHHPGHGLSPRQGFGHPGAGGAPDDSQSQLLPVDSHTGDASSVMLLESPSASEGGGAQRQLHRQSGAVQTHEPLVAVEILRPDREGAGQAQATVGDPWVYHSASHAGPPMCASQATEPPADGPAPASPSPLHRDTTAPAFHSSPAAAAAAAAAAVAAASAAGQSPAAALALGPVMEGATQTSLEFPDAAAAAAAVAAAAAAAQAAARRRVDEAAQTSAEPEPHSSVAAQATQATAVGGDDEGATPPQRRFPRLATAQPFLGFSLCEVEGAEELTVDAIFDAGPAGTAGLRLGDAVARIDGRQVTTLEAARAAIADVRVGGLCVVSLRRYRRGGLFGPLADSVERDEDDGLGRSQTADGGARTAAATVGGISPADEDDEAAAAAASVEELEVRIKALTADAAFVGHRLFFDRYAAEQREVVLPGCDLRPSRRESRVVLAAAGAKQSGAPSSARSSSGGSEPDMADGADDTEEDGSGASPDVET